jgi:hypothetical protein
VNAFLARKSLLPAVVICVLLISTGASAWDNERKGFILGYGLGPCLDMNKQSAEIIGIEIGKIDTESKFGVCDDFKIGYAPSNQLLIFFASKSSIFQTDWLDWRGTEFGMYTGVTAVNNFSGVGMAYYIDPAAPSLFFTGGLGLSAALALESGPDPRIGFGFFGGGGFEFTPHWNVEGNFRWSSSTDEELFTDFTFEDIVLSLTINILGY